MDTHHDQAAETESESHQPAPRKPRTRGRLILRLTIMTILLVVVFGALYGYDTFRTQATAKFFASMKPPALPVAAATATTSAVPRYLTGIGSLNAVHQVTIAPETGGRVTKILFDAGATVKAGTPLVQMNDDPERGDLANYEAQARLAQSNLSRATKLAARDFETKANVDTYNAQLAQAQAQIARTRAMIAQKLVRAPFDGVLGIRQVDLGQYVSAGMKLVTLTDLDTLYVDLTLPEGARSQLDIGQKVLVRVDAFPNRDFEAELSTIEPQVDPDMRTIKLRATLKNPDHLLLPGMFVHARLVLPPRPGVVTVPETAIDHSLYGDSVFLIVKDEGGEKQGWHVKRTYVTTGEHFGDRVAVLSGISAGDRVVASGQLKLTDNAAVTPTADTLVPPANAATD